MTFAIIAGVAALLPAAYVFYVHPWLDDREITREMTRRESVARPA